MSLVVIYRNWPQGW